MLRHLAVALVLVPNLAGQGALAATEIGKLVAVQNEVALEGGGSGPHPLSVGSAIREGETLVSATASNAEVELQDQTKLAIGPEARLVLGRFSYKAGKSPGSIALTLSRGAFRFMTGNAPKAAYDIKTPTASLGLRGTIFDAFISDTGDTAVLVHEGNVNVCNKARSCVLQGQGQGIVVVDAEGVISVQPRWNGSLMPGVSPSTAFPFVGRTLAIDPVRRFPPNDSSSEPAVAETPAEPTNTPVGHLANVRGVVLVNMGLGFQPVSGDTPILPGYRVQAVTGSADIVYDNGTTVPVTSGQVALVLSSSPAGEVPSASGFSAPILIGGVAGAAGLAVALSNVQSAHPASP